ncbi:MAG: hypothetical protein AD073_000040 [Mycoplasmataceae bacterium]|nr:MAG: hypothetical protein AD073_000040 [Mycoplasmataceae bacterium]
MKKYNQQYHFVVKRKNTGYNNYTSYIFDFLTSFFQTFYWFFSSFLLFSVSLILIFLGFNYYVGIAKAYSLKEFKNVFKYQFSRILLWINNNVFLGNWRFFKGIALTFFSLLIIWKFFTSFIFNRQKRVYNEIIEIDNLFKNDSQNKTLKLSLIQAKIDLFELRKLRSHFNYYFLIPLVLINVIIFFLVHIFSENKKSSRNRRTAYHRSYNYGCSQPYYGYWYPFFWNSSRNSFFPNNVELDEIDSLDGEYLKKEFDKTVLEVESEQ